MIKLLLLTPTLRKDNLIRLAKSIVSEFTPLRNIIEVTWIICLDQYNSYGSLGELESYCTDNELSYQIHLSGLPDQKNYGGDLFNSIILPKLSSDEFGEDPWLYILDDDNIIHPLLPHTLIRCELLNSDKRIIWLSKVRETGVTDQAPQCMAMHKFPLSDGQYFVPAQLSPDPSQLIIKASIIKEVGGYGSGFTYDFQWCLPLCEQYSSEIFFFNEYNPNSIDLTHCYHNGLRTEQDFRQDEKILVSGIPVEVHLTICSDDESKSPRIYPIDRVTALRLLSIIKSSYEL